MAEVGSAFVTIAPSARNWTRQIESQVGSQLDRAGKSGAKRFGNSFGSAFKSVVGPALAVVSTAAVGGFLKDAIGEAREAQKVGALTNNVIKQTGGIAKITSKQVGNLATSISNKTGMDDEAIQSGANLLLTFKAVRNETGKGAKIFDRATQAAADLSAAGFGDLGGASKQLGKALNDPLKGISALGRAGVTFNDQQKAQIKTLVSQNDILGAQKIILGEVESQVGGAAAASSTLGEKASVAFGNFKESIGTALLPVLDDFNRKLVEDGVPAGERFADFFSTKAVPAIRDFGDTAGPLAKSTLPAISSALRSAGDAAKVLAPPVKSIIDAFNSLPKSVQTAVVLGGVATAVGGKSKSSLAGTAASAGGKGNLPAAAAIGTLFAGGNLLDSVDTAKRAQKSLEGIAKSLAATYDKNGRATAASVKMIKTAFESGNVGKYADDLGVDLDKLAKSFANNGIEGKYVQETLKSLGSRYSVTKDILDDPLQSVLGSTESSKIASFRGQLEKLEPDYTAASRGAYRAGNQTKDLTALMLGGKKATKDLGINLDVLGKKNPSPRVSTPGLGGAVGAVSGFAKDLARLDKAVARPKVILGGGAGAAIGAIGASLDRLAVKSARIKVGANAKGTNNWRGGLTWVGEEGPELINLARGAQVIPNHKIGDVGAGSTLRAAGSSGAMDLSDDTIGALIDGLLEAIESGAGAIVDSQSAHVGQLTRMDR